MTESKVVKKKNNTTKTEIKSKKTIEDKVVKKKNMGIEDIPQELLAQIIAMAKESMSSEKAVEPVIKKSEKPEKITKAYLNKIKEKEVVVKSVNGNVTFKSPKTNIMYQWLENGDEEVLTISEILAMESSSKRFLHTPWLIVEDDDVVEALALGRLYHVINKIENIEELLDMEIYEIENLIKEVPKEFKNSLSSNILIKVQSGELRDYILIQELERILGKTFR